MIPRYRAWDVKNKSMLEDIGIHANRMVIYTKEGFEVKTNFKTDFIPLQSTGLHDKNGREIFESDIIIHSDNYKGMNFVVKWQREYPSFKLFYNDKEMMCQLWDKEYKVIGTIYQNPELLK